MWGGWVYTWCVDEWVGGFHPWWVVGWHPCETREWVWVWVWVLVGFSGWRVLVCGCGCHPWYHWRTHSSFMIDSMLGLPPIAAAISAGRLETAGTAWSSNTRVTARCPRYAASESAEHRSPKGKEGERRRKKENVGEREKKRRRESGNPCVCVCVGVTLWPRISHPSQLGTLMHAWY